MFNTVGHWVFCAQCHCLLFTATHVAMLASLAALSGFHTCPGSGSHLHFSPPGVMMAKPSPTRSTRTMWITRTCGLALISRRLTTGPMSCETLQGMLDFSAPMPQHVRPIELTDRVDETMHFCACDILISGHMFLFAFRTNMSVPDDGRSGACQCTLENNVYFAF